MKASNQEYKGFIIEKRIDVKSSTCIIYKNQDIIKCIAGDISSIDTENSIEKAKKWIDSKSN